MPTFYSQITEVQIAGQSSSKIETNKNKSSQSINYT